MSRETGGFVNSAVSGCFWLFALKFCKVAGTYEMSFCLKRNGASVVLAMLGGGDTQALLESKMNFMH